MTDTVTPEENLRTDGGILLKEPEEKTLSVEERVRIIEDKVETWLNIPVYSLIYRHNNSVKPKMFRFDGDIVQARNRARTHCGIMGYTFIIVNFGICDLGFQEEMKLSGKFESNSEVLS